MNKIGSLVLAAVMVVGVGGCATSSAPGAAPGADPGKPARTGKVQDADIGLVRTCDFVGTVIGSANLEGGDVARAMEKAKASAREQAANAGATHVFWAVESRGYTTSVQGQAYLCK